MSNQDLSATVAVALVEPQLGENIGAAARAMWNCGFSDLRLVNPRDEWPNQKARAAATGAAGILENTCVFSSLAQAVGEAQHVFAFSARCRELPKPVITPTEMAQRVLAAAGNGERSVLVFGPERTGLGNFDVATATALVRFPLNPAFQSLNLAQAVLLSCWELLSVFRSAEVVVTSGETPIAAGSVAGALGPGLASLGNAVDHTPGDRDAVALGNDPPATAQELEEVFHHLESQLDEAKFFRPIEKRGRMILQLRTLLRRCDPGHSEVRLLHGVVAALSGRRRDGAPVRLPGAKRLPTPDSNTSGQDGSD